MKGSMTTLQIKQNMCRASKHIVSAFVYVADRPLPSDPRVQSHPCVGSGPESLLKRKEAEASKPELGARLKVARVSGQKSRLAKIMLQTTTFVFSSHPVSYADLANQLVEKICAHKNDETGVLGAIELSLGKATITTHVPTSVNIATSIKFNVPKLFQPWSQ